jgi:hypothetical protein
MKIKIIHQWRDWLLENVGGDQYSFIKKDDQTVRTIVAKSDMDAENQCQSIIRESINMENSEFIGDR